MLSELLSGGMMLFGYATRAFVLLTVNEWGRVLRRWRGGMLLVLSLGLFAVLGHVASTMYVEVAAAIQVISRGSETPGMQQVIEQFGMGDLAESVRALRHVDGHLWLLQVAAVVWLPLVSTLLSFDAVASDRASGRVRFLMQRVGRTTYLLSKLAAHIGIALATYLSGFFVFLGFLVSHQLPLPSVASGAPVVVTICALVAQVAVLTVVVSSFSKTPTRAMVAVNLWWIFFLLIGVLWPGLAPLRSEWLSAAIFPTEYQLAAGSVGGLLLWTLAFASLGILRWRARDL